MGNKTFLSTDMKTEDKEYGIGHFIKPEHIERVLYQNLSPKKSIGFVNIQWHQLK